MGVVASPKMASRCELEFSFDYKSRGEPQQLKTLVSIPHTVSVRETAVRLININGLPGHLLEDRLTAELDVFIREETARWRDRVGDDAILKALEERVSHFLIKTRTHNDMVERYHILTSHAPIGYRQTCKRMGNKVHTEPRPLHDPQEDPRRSFPIGLPPTSPLPRTHHPTPIRAHLQHVNEQCSQRCKKRCIEYAQEVRASHMDTCTRVLIMFVCVCRHDKELEDTLQKTDTDVNKLMKQHVFEKKVCVCVRERERGDGASGTSSAGMSNLMCLF